MASALHTLFGAQAVNVGEDFRQDGVEFGGHDRAHVKLGQRQRQVGVFLNRDTALTGQGNDAFGQFALAAGHHDGGDIGGRVIPQGNSPATSVAIRYGHRR